MCSNSNLLSKHTDIPLKTGELMKGDLKVKQGKIVEIGTNLNEDNINTIIDATDLTLLPGAIDP
jgi:dihydroorotase